MAVTRAAPWWLGWLFAAGLVALFAGERVLAGIGPARALLSGLGVLVTIACVLWRAFAWREAGDEARRVEGWLLLAYLGCVLALVGYLISSEEGMSWLGIEFVNEEARARYRVIAQVFWTILLAISLLPALGAQLALGQHRHARGDASAVESTRILETATAGLAIALAGALLFVVGYVASERDETLDLSYFKTATPGAATEALVAGLEEPLRVLLFFPEVNPVKDEVLRYFRELADATGRLRIEEYDRLASPRLAAEHRVVRDGTIVFLRGDQSGQLTPGASLASARTFLRSLDREIQTSLMPIVRRRPNVYLTTGHGELNDSIDARSDSPLGSVRAFSEMLSFLGYEPKDLGLAHGLGNQVPADADAVLVLGPRRPFLPEELAALDRYVAGGGSLLLALDPDSDFRMEQLERNLGVRYIATPLANDEFHMQQRGDASDRRLIITDRFSSHEAMTTLARAGVGTGVLLVGPGHLESTDAPGTSPVFVVRALPSTFADPNRDYRFNEDTEARDSYPLVAAVERRAAPTPMGDGRPDSTTVSDTGAPGPDSSITSRALVYATSSAFTDAVLVSLGNNAAMIADGIRWLAREERLAGATETEEDVPIVHTRDENVIWFYSTILGAPALALGAGLLSVFRRGHRRRTEP